MKKALLFVIVALSINVFAQKNYLPANSRDNADPSSLNRVFDSIYCWTWDEYYQEWKYKSKTKDIVYDGDNNWISDLHQVWWDNIWYDDTLTSSTYDANHNLISKSIKIWAYIDSVWYDSYRWINAYDVDNKIVSNTHQYCYDGIWHDKERWIYTYDTRKNLVDESFQNWNTDDNQWGNSYHHAYTYDASNNQTSKLSQVWASTIWVNYELTTSFYDDANNLIHYVRQDWVSSEWLNELQDSLIYDSENKLVTEIYQSRSGYSWGNALKIIYTYNANNYLIRQDYQAWKNYSYWEDDFKYDFTYDSNNNLLSKVVSGWDWHTQLWSIFNLYLFTYDENNFNISYSYKGLEIGTGTVSLGDSIHYYSHASTGINELITDDASIFISPNPNKGKFKICSENPISSIEIFNLPGKLVYASYNPDSRNFANVDISRTAKGIHIIKIFTGQKFLTKKIIVY
jgi:hypothetical protein